MKFALGPEATAGGYRLAAYDTIGSTSAEALARARDGDPGRLWVVARAQTAGHGRRGRPWATPSGNLAASLLLRIAAAPHAATLGFVAGLAVVDAIRACAPSPCLRLKWPNDVLIDGAKVAGILLEAATSPDGPNHVVVGIGVNVRHAPAGVPYPVASLAGCGVDVGAGRLFEALSRAWVEQAELWDHGRGFAAIRRAWLARAAGLGEPIAVSAGAEFLRGTFETIDADGRLVLRTAGGATHRISAGEVYFGAAATAGHAYAG